MSGALHTPRTLLADIGEDDQPLIFKGLSDPQVIEFYGVSFDSLESTGEQMHWYRNLEQQKTGKWWKLLGSNEEFLGAGGLNGFDAKQKTIEIGFWLLPEHWGKGYMTEVMPAICKHAFNSFEAEKIVGVVEAENTACRKALRKLGFEDEGKTPEEEIKDGKVLDLHLYSLKRKKDSTEGLRIGVNLLNALKGILGQ
jgi:ribosomal-protein-alanine N-acetyltransferase